MFFRKSRLDCMFPVCVGVFPDGPQHARVRKAAAQNTADGDTDVLIGGTGLYIEDSLCGEDHVA